MDGYGIIAVYPLLGLSVIAVMIVLIQALFGFVYGVVVRWIENAESVEFYDDDNN